LEKSKLDTIRRVELEAEKEAKAACEAMEKEIRSQYELDKKRRREEWRRQIEEECQKKFHGSASATADSTAPKQSRPEAEADLGDRASDSAQSDGVGGIGAKPAGETVENPEGQDESPDRQEEPHESSSSSATPLLPPSESLLTAEATEKAATSRLTAQQEILQEAQQNVDKLQEKRGEIVWLLKQVIKAEEKAKARQQQQQQQQQNDKQDASSGA
jgi:E3 ubiquitin-protein ligase HUWE1